MAQLLMDLQEENRQLKELLRESIRLLERVRPGMFNKAYASKYKEDVEKLIAPVKNDGWPCECELKLPKCTKHCEFMLHRFEGSVSRLAKKGL